VRILIDITHPAHVHFFRGAISELQNRGHKIAVTTREKDITINLLKDFGIPFTTLSKVGHGRMGLFRELIIRDFRLWKFCRRFKPDVLTGISGVFAAHVGWLLRKPAIIWDDTEHQRLAHMITFPFTDIICTPSCYLDDLGSKQIRYAGYHELAYLHPNCFKPDPAALDYLGVKKDEKFIIMRFVSWAAIHDVGHKGLSIEMKRRSVKELSKHAKVFITSESDLPQDLKPYQIKIPHKKIHDALYYATMYFGDGGTMASESAILGTPAINIATSAVLIGNFADMEKYGLMYIIPDEKRALEKALELLETKELESEMKPKREKLISQKTDVTKFMVWLIENYPQSIKIMKETPDYQKNFK